MTAPSAVSMNRRSGPGMRARMRSKRWFAMGPGVSAGCGEGAGGGLGPQRARDRRRGDDDALLGVGLVVLLDRVEVVEVVHHQALRLRKPLRRQVAQRVDALQARAVAEMEPRDGVDRDRKSTRL